MSDRTRRVTAIAQASYEAATEAMDKIIESEAVTDEEATATFGTALMWPGVNYLVQIGATKEEVLRVAGELYDQLEGLENEPALN